MLGYSTGKPFSEDFDNLARENIQSILSDIKGRPDEYFNSISIDDYEAYLLSKYSIESFPVLHWEEVQLEFDKAQIPGRNLPPEFIVIDSNKTFSKPRVTYIIPISGNIDLLRYRQSRTWSSGVIHGELGLHHDSLHLSIIDIYGDSNIVEKFFEESKQRIRGKVGALQAEISTYNRDLIQFIKDKVNKRVSGIKRDKAYQSKFKHPVRKKGVPQAFELPKVVKKDKIAPTPRSKNIAASEYSISDDDYHRILELLQDCGRNWEQHPEIYKDKDEEALRDQLIFVLAPNIEGVVAGEAYNKYGRTDISIKHGTNNLFIGECKFWKGLKGFTDTIDQILNYLTWRDSKAAIMMFVTNKDISSVQLSVSESVEQHPNYVRLLEKINEGWSNYKFHLSHDPGTFLTIAIQLYHIP
jgi:hypothetical protein